MSTDPSFEENYYKKFKNSKIIGTGYLAYRDIPSIVKLHRSLGMAQRWSAAHKLINMFFYDKIP